MTKRNALALVTASLIAATALAAELSPDHQRWLDEEVVYIITPREKEVFEQLETYEERERFIEAFWKRRDPNPATPENEFRIEHDRRIVYANQWLGRETYLPGWKTDRGRIYIILGEPLQRQTFDDMDDIVPSELWFYQAPEESGLPPHFYVLFYQRNLVGEFRLYSPVADEPDRLVRGMTALAADTRQSIAALKLASPELAQASLSFDPNEPMDLSSPRGSLTSGLIVSRIEDLPRRAAKTDYLDAYLAYGNRVSADYSFNYVPSRGALTVLVGPEETPFVHYGLELDPTDFSLETDEQKSRFYTTLDVSLEVRDPAGRLVDATDKEVFLEFTRSQMAAIERAPIAYQDDFPLVPGEYRVSVVLRNRVSKQYTVLDQELTVPDFGEGSPVLSGLAIGYRADRAATGDEVQRPFQVGSTRIEPAANGVFAIGDTIHVACTALHAPAGALVRLRLTVAGQERESRERPLSDFENGQIVDALSRRRGRRPVRAERGASRRLRTPAVGARERPHRLAALRDPEGRRRPPKRFRVPRFRAARLRARQPAPFARPIRRGRGGARAGDRSRQPEPLRGEVAARERSSGNGRAGVGAKAPSFSRARLSEPVRGGRRARLRRLSNGGLRLGRHPPRARP